MSKIEKQDLYIITTIVNIFYIIPTKIQALVLLCDEFLYYCIVEICTKNCFIYIYEQVKNTWGQVQTLGKVEKK